MVAALVLFLPPIQGVYGVADGPSLSRRTATAFRARHRPATRCRCCDYPRTPRHSSTRTGVRFGPAAYSAHAAAQRRFLVCTEISFYTQPSRSWCHRLLLGLCTPCGRRVHLGEPPARRVTPAMLPLNYNYISDGLIPSPPVTNKPPSRLSMNHRRESTDTCCPAAADP